MAVGVGVSVVFSFGAMAMYLRYCGRVTHITVLPRRLGAEDDSNCEDDDEKNTTETSGMSFQTSTSFQ